MGQQFRLIIAFLAILGNLVLVPNAKAATSNDLKITVDGLKKQQGQICFSVFARSKGFPSKKASSLRNGCIKVAENSVELNFKNLKAGNYAVAVFHDVNSDGALNRNFVGIPTEGFGFTNNPKILNGPPKFNDSAVLVAGSSTNTQINLQYLL